MNYIKATIQLEPLQPAREVIYADLDEAGFESIVDTDNGVEAYIPENLYNENLLNDLMVHNMAQQKVIIAIEIIEKQNWNATWENHFEIIEINQKCSIRAPFHNASNKEFDIIIAPQMSFGTGHHETTFLMSKRLFEIDVAQKSVLDMGCGTAVLAIIAQKLGAQKCIAIDIEDWAYQNALDNCELNDVSQIKVILGDATKIEDAKFDIILANINRNILLQDMPIYANAMLPNAQLLLSGFYDTDINSIRQQAQNCGLKFVSQEVKNNWSCLHFTKPNS